MNSFVGDGKPFTQDSEAASTTKFPCDGIEFNSQKKRLEMSLSKVTHFSDQTPTPTRLLRECEEFGLFQDLHDVNPFEETFRKAVEATKNGESPLLGKSNENKSADDTLHTPNVFPLMNEPQILDKSNGLENPAKESVKVKKISELQAPKPARPYQKKKLASNCTNSHNYILLDENVTFKLPIPRLPCATKVFSPKYFSVLAKNASKTAVFEMKEPISKKKELSKELPRNRKDILESNRLAQMRARNKKKHYVAYLEQFNQELLEKNNTLEGRVAALEAENIELKNKLANGSKSHKNNGGRDASLQTEPSPSIETENFAQLNNKVNLKAKNYLQEKSEIFYSSIPTNESSSVSCDGFLRKPLKKRSVPPKLTLNCCQEPIS